MKSSKRKGEGTEMATDSGKGRKKGRGRRSVGPTACTFSHRPRMGRPAANASILLCVLMSFLTTSCATNSSIPIVIINNHNVSEFEQFTFDSTVTESATLPSTSITGGTVTTLTSALNKTTVSEELHGTESNTSTNESDLLSLYFSTPLNNSSAPASAPTANPLTDAIESAGSEQRLRWVDYRARPQPAFPPRVPTVHGIPSGFRNPATFGPSVPQHPPHGFGPSSSNPVGFAGSVPSFVASPGQTGLNRRPTVNMTRVEHIAAECSDDYMKVTIHFNGTFTGLIYSAGYVHDPNCIYVNGTGRNHYEFFIRLNQCGTLGREEMYNPQRPGEVRRRDQVMWNTLSIQYNPLIEEEWDEHYRVTCEYGSDFWKTVTFPAVNVEVNTGSPVVFTINPPQCQMEIRRGFGMAGTRTSGPVTVGDPLTLLIHMKSEKDGFDILVKNCIAHNGAQQRLQLIDPNGCVTNEKLISPFRGTYNTDDGHQVTLYAYLKAFRFTGSPALYLECDIHMCHNKCPPQRCYWRNLSKRSLRSVLTEKSPVENPVVSESISLFQALEVRHDNHDTHGSDEGDVARERRLDNDMRLGSKEPQKICFRPDGVAMFGLAMAFVLIASTTVSVCSYFKLRKLKQRQCEDIVNKTPYENLCYPSNRRRF